MMRRHALKGVVLAVLLASGAAPSSAAPLNARDAVSRDAAPLLPIAAAPSAKQQCLAVCRTRYRDCLARKQIPAGECRGVYQDCSRIACTNLRI